MNNYIKIILRILNKREKFQVFFIVFFSIVRAFLEMLGIGLLIPLLSLISDINKESFIYNYFPQLSLLNNKQLISFFIVGFIFVYLIKTIFVIFFNIYTAKFSQNLFVSLTEKVLKNYLSRDYIFFTENNSANLIRNISSETNVFALGVVGNVVIIISNSVLFLSICFFLIFYNFYTIYSMLALILISFFVIKKNAKKFGKWGQKRVEHASGFLKKLNEILGSIKEVMLYNKESFYLKQIQHHLKELATSSIYKDSFISITSPIVEFFGIFIFFIFFLILLYFSKINFSEIIVLFGIFAFASLRLLPNIIGIVRSFQNLKFNLPSVNIINEEFVNNNYNKKENNKVILKNELGPVKSILFEKVSFSYSSKLSPTLKNINLEILSGDKVCIIGETGSGKTTLLNIISGLLLPSEGKIKINKDLALSLYGIKESIGYVSQTTYLTDDTISSNIALKDLILEEDFNKIQNIIKVLNLNNLDQLIKSSKKDFSVGERGSRLSGGQIQRIGIARAIYRDPSILILDEATSALDEKTEKSILDFLFGYMKNGIIIFSTHRKSVLKYCNKILEVKNNEVNLLDNKKNI